MNVKRTLKTHSRVLDLCRLVIFDESCLWRFVPHLIFDPSPVTYVPCITDEYYPQPFPATLRCHVRLIMALPEHSCTTLPSARMDVEKDDSYPPSELDDTISRRSVQIPGKAEFRQASLFLGI